MRDGGHDCAASTAPGFFGKLPALGDFVSRRVPAALRAPWETWLQRVIAGSREALDDEWTASYLAGAPWRFVLAAGACGPCAVAGVMVPSTDRAGRCYPITVFAGVDPWATPLSVLNDGRAWFDRVESVLAGVATDDRHGLERLDAALTVLGSEALPSRRLATASGRAFEAAGTAPDAGSVWATRGTEHIDATVLFSPAMPSSECFASMLDGDWSAVAPVDDAPPAEPGAGGFP